MDDLLNGAIQSVDAKLDERIREANAAKKPFEDAIYGYLQKEQAANRLKNIGDSYDLTFAQVVAGIPGFDLAAYEAALKAKIKALYAVKSQTLVWRFSETLPALIDNQPQFVVTGAVRNAHDLVGADLYSITTSYELGLVNFNSVIKEYRRLRRKYQDARAEQGPQGQLKPPTPFEAYRNVAGRRKVLNEDKIVFSATYKTQRAYDVSYDYVETVTDPLSGTEVTVPHMANADLPSAHEVHAQVNWTRFVTPKKTGEATPRVDFSIEYVDVSNDPSRQNRLIGRVTYTLASQGGVGIPLTLTYANHSEFLGEQDRVLSAHVGVSYKVCRNR